MQLVCFHSPEGGTANLTSPIRYVTFDLVDTLRNLSANPECQQSTEPWNVVPVNLPNATRQIGRCQSSDWSITSPFHNSNWWNLKRWRTINQRQRASPTCRAASISWLQVKPKLLRRSTVDRFYSTFTELIVVAHW